MPIIPPHLQLQTITGKAILSWHQPKGFFTGLAIKACHTSGDCSLYPVAMNATSLQLEAGLTYRLVVYQHHQEVIESAAFVEQLPLHGND